MCQQKPVQMSDPDITSPLMTDVCKQYALGKLLVWSAQILISWDLILTGRNIHRVLQLLPNLSIYI